MDQSKFKYKTSFNFSIYATNDLENDLSISLASLNNLRPLIPSSVDLEKNIDLVGVAFNAAVVNKFNKNGDGINSETADEILKYFVYKPTNIEHKKEKVVGHIVNAGFTDLNNDKILTSKEAISRKTPYYISLAAVVYKTVNTEFANALIQASDPESEAYNKISASWELGFNDYHIAVGSTDLEEAKIITEPDEIEDMKKYLKSFGGSGKLSNGDPVYRLVTGEVFPLGIGFTSNPAADVQGVFIEKNDDITLKDSEESSEKSEKQTISIENSRKISQKSENNVKTNNNTDIMDTQEIIQEFGKILDSKLSEKAEFSQEAVASISTFVADKIREKDVEFQQERDALEQQKIQAAEDAEKAKVSISELEENLKTAQDRISDLEGSIAAQQAEEIFNSRMETVDEGFDLSDSDRAIIAKEVQALDSSEASFETYQEKLNSLLHHKSKAFKLEQEEQLSKRVEQEVEKRIASIEAPEPTATPEKEVEEVKASETDVEEVLDRAEASEEAPVNNNGASAQEESLLTKFSKAFNKENIQIKY
jgi:hypothetical protein